MTERMIIIDALLRVAVLVVTAILIPAVKSWVDRNADNSELNLVLKMAKVAVESVENDLATEDGKVRKRAAMERLAKQIESWGLKGFTTDELDHYIETAVKQMWIDEQTAMPISLDTNEFR